MATHDRSGNSYGSPAKAKTNAERGGYSSPMEDPFVGEGVTHKYGESGNLIENRDMSKAKQDKNSIGNSKLGKDLKMQDKTVYGNEVKDTTSSYNDPNRQTKDGKMLPGLSPFGDD